MNKIIFNIIPAKNKSGNYYDDTERVEILIDGEPLHLSVFNFEKENISDREVHPYGYVRPSFLFNELNGKSIEKSNPTILGCTCGEEVCAAFLFEINSGTKTVSWKPSGCVFDKKYDYSSFPEITFLKEDYDTELSKLRLHLSENGRKVNDLDFVAEERNCYKCNRYQLYSHDHDAYYCSYCNMWLEENCEDKECSHCKYRADKPFMKKGSKHETPLCCKI